MVIASESITHTAEGLIILSSDNKTRPIKCKEVDFQSSHIYWVYYVPGTVYSIKLGSRMKSNRKRVVSHTAIYVWKD